jgi:uncharacterized protein YciI/uncharacterized protein YndB with AHSA1/START domain
MSAVVPIRRETVVDADPDLAFRVFTEQIGRWWPVAEKSVHGAGSTVYFDSVEIVEVSGDGERTLWGTVIEWRPGERVAFTWHPGADAERASHVTVTFSAVKNQTLVSLVHDGWEVFADPAAARAEYDEGWPIVIASFTEHVAAATSEQDDDGDTWVALLHRPGPNAPREGSLFAAPGFGDHVAFLTRMRDAGLLVAAGPLLDANGEGMTVLRLPGANRLDEARHFATDDDASVANGFFTVEVRPWQVMLEA